MSDIQRADLDRIQEEGTTTQVEPPHSAPPPTSSTVLNRVRSNSSAVSRVDIDYFDPSGFQQLERTLTAASRKQSCRKKPRKPKPKDDDTASQDSDLTLALGDGPFDLAKTARTLAIKREEADIKTRRLGVLFKDLRVVGLGSTASYIPTLGSVVNPRSILETIQNIRHPPVRDILSGFDGVIRPGEMLLVLGRPGSGCTTFLKTLANQRDEFYRVEGQVHYDSLTPEKITKHYRGDVQYCPEDDVHFPTLTVEQTLNFAAKMRTPQTRIASTRAKFIDFATELVSTVLGLRHTLKTFVGDAAIRGVSGGEKKRVSIAEALTMRSRVNAWDNSTRGLDASTALEFGRALRLATDVDHLSTIVSIYQAGEMLYQLFDKVCVIYEGRMAYFGPADQAKQYFIDMGYEPANRQTTPDFLVSVTDPNGRVTRNGATNVPRTAAEFAAYFQKSVFAARNKEDMQDYENEFVGVEDLVTSYKQSTAQEHARTARLASPYTISIPMQVRAVMNRRVQILIGNKMATIMNLASFILQGVIVGTVFLKLPESTAAYFSRGGVLFFALLFSALSSLAEIPALFHQRPIVSRHQKAALYHPFTEAVALTLVDLPITFACTAIFGIIIYFIVGLQRSASQFFVFLLFLFTMAVVMKAWFRAIAAAFKSEATAQSVSGIVLLGLTIYTGYTIPKPSMIGALRWISYINPLRYGFEGVLANEFRTLNGACSSLVPQGPGYEDITLANQVCASVGALPGQPTVDGNRYIQFAYGYSYSNTWMNFGIVLAFGVAFVSALFIFSEFNTSLSGDTTVVQYKRGSKAAAPKVATDDEEKGRPDSAASSDTGPGVSKEIAQEMKMTDVFSWQHLNYTVPVSGGTRQLLNDISGFVAPGKLTALMGESGAGKTTLLNVLAKRTSVGVITGHEYVNGHALPADFQAQSGYCQQMDTHVPTDTVREALLFSAKLRQPSSVPLAEKEAYVETCLRMCGLEAVADASVGSLGVEHRKRTTIGVELAAKPKLLLFLDEPTSGLDSQSAWAIMAFLRQLADNGQAILCTIHQPSGELFQVFDRLLLLRKGGQTVYFGDIGPQSSTMISYFQRNGSRECHPDENPAEFILDVIGAGATATADRDWHTIWANSVEAKELQKELERIHTEGRSRGAVQTTLHSAFATSWPYQLGNLFTRDVRSHWRDPTYLIAKLALNIMAGLFIGFTFFKAKDSQQGTQNKLFAIFMSTILAAPLSNQLQVPYVKMRSIYEIRERPTRMYSWSALVASQVLAEIPWNILASSIFFLCWFWTVGFPNDRAGYTYLMYGVLFPLYYTTFAQAVASMVPTTELAAIAFSFLFSFVLTFNGVMQPFRLLGWWQWMYRLSPFTYLVEGLLGQALGHQQIRCSSLEFVSVTPPSGQTCGQYFERYISNAGGYLQNADASSACEFCPFSSTDDFLRENFNIYYAHRWRNVGIFCAYVVFNVFLIFSLTYLFRIRQGSLLGSLRRRLAARRS